MSSAFERLQKIAEEKRLKEIAEKPRLEVVEKINNQKRSEAQMFQGPTQPIIPNQHNQHNIANPTISISPEKDFTKVANSIAREAVPERFFKGMSKNTYDALYLKTRGAINPVRRIRATKSDLIRWTGVSDVTIDKHIKHLKLVGLLKVDFIIGSHEGNWYEIFIPEEVNLHDQPNQPNLTKKVGGEVPNLVGGVGGVDFIENKQVTEIPKTSFKDIEKNDDEPFGRMTETLAKAFEKVSGKTPQKSDAAKLNELAELLTMELEIAAARTKSISNVPAFLTEHLRRRLLGKPDSTKSAELKSKTSQSLKAVNSIGTETIDEYEAEPLSKEGREAVLKTMQEYIEKGQKEFVMSQQDTYTKDDWEWLTKKLEQERSNKQP